MKITQAALKTAIMALLLLTSVVASASSEEYIYTYKDRDHRFLESTRLLSTLYVISWGTYYMGQENIFREEGSFAKYRKNMFHPVFDKDNPYWNWGMHPLTGSQLYLFYRANGYTRMNALGMTFLQSAFFEFTTEVYTEPPSYQDLYQTPILGAILGYGLEKISLVLINSEWQIARVVGHILNPSTLFWFYEGKVQVYPTVQKSFYEKDTGGEQNKNKNKNKNRNSDFQPAVWMIVAF
ncbi:MAG: DUF3943 domain-containing protein [Oligoflexia bacterium]|nr:DUF3943 domain-containing protein [Oligoflexia bacterium]